MSTDPSDSTRNPPSGRPGDGGASAREDPRDWFAEEAVDGSFRVGDPVAYSHND